MGAGTSIGIWSLIAGIFLIIFGGLLCLTLIGAIIGIPMILAGFAIIGGGAAAGGAVGIGRMVSKNQKDVRVEQREELKLKAELISKGLCTKCGASTVPEDNFCKECGNVLRQGQVIQGEITGKKLDHGHGG